MYRKSKAINFLPKIRSRTALTLVVCLQEEVTLYCQAWAKNIDTERTYLDKVTNPSQGFRVAIAKTVNYKIIIAEPS